MKLRHVGLCVWIGIVLMEVLETVAQCGCSACAARKALPCNSLPPSSGMVVRPVELPKLNLAALMRPRYVVKQLPSLFQPLTPEGGLCSCKATVVTPGIPRPAPPPPCGGYNYRIDAASKMMQKYAAASAASLSYNVPPPPPPPVLPPPTYGPPVLPAALPPPPPDPVPVPTDPVSMQLAFKAQEMAGRAVEDKLSFGFRSMPADGTINKALFKKNCIPEENLLALNGAVVELKPPALVQVAKSVDEEAEEALMMEQINDKSKVQTVASSSKPTLGQLGFGPAMIAPPPTLTIQGASASSAASAASTSISGVPGTPSLGCPDLVPGQVLQGTVPKPETYIFPAPPLPPCSADEEARLLPPPPPPQAIQPVPVAVPVQAPTYSYASAASAASASQAAASMSMQGTVAAG